MPVANVNLDEVREKPPLPLGQPLTFGFKQPPTLEQSQQPNKKTQQREWNVKCQLVPLDPQWLGSGFDYTVYHNWSLAPGALSSPEASFSIKKFFAIVGFKWNSDGSFSTEEMSMLRFVGTLKAGKAPNEAFPQLDKVLGPAA